MLSPSLSRPVLLGSLALWLGLAAGCSSDSDSRPERDASVAAPDYPTTMTGSENFADGKIVVEVTLGMPANFHPGKDGGQKGSSGSGGGGHHHGGGGGRRGGGGMGGYGGGDMGGQPPSGGESDDGIPRPHIVGSTLPPAQIKLHLKNTTGESISCEIVDFNSSLGNFAVYPATYKLDANQSVISDTMTSRLGVEGSEIPITVGVRVRGGEPERKVVTLHLLESTAKPAEPSSQAK